jgi:hypothetical protein
MQRVLLYILLALAALMVVNTMAVFNNDDDEASDSSEQMTEREQELMEDMLMKRFKGNSALDKCKAECKKRIKVHKRKMDPFKAQSVQECNHICEENFRSGRR